MARGLLGARHPGPAVGPLRAILADEQARVNGYVTEVVDPVRGRMIQAGTPFSTSPPSRVTGPAPALGAHTEEVLAEASRRPSADPSDDGSGAGPDGGRPSPGASVRSPLQGLRVLDLGNFLAGPLGPMLLADLVPT